MRKKFLRGLLVGGGAFSVAFLLHLFGLFLHLEWKSWDWRMRLFSDPSRASDGIVILLVDQKSLDLYEKQQGLPWPWPREIYAAVIRYLQAGGAKAVFFDLIFSETSRYGVEDDESFAKAIAGAGNVFLAFFLSGEETEDDDMSMTLLERFSLPGEKIPSGAVHPAKSAALPLETLLRSAGGAGNVRFAPDDDGIFRRMPLFFSLGDMVLPSLPPALAAFSGSGKVWRDVPLDRSGQMIIRYHGPTGTYRMYSIAAIINSWALMEEGKKPQIPPDEFAGKIVLIGSSAAGLFDLRPTPFSPVCPGVEIHATAVDNLLHGDFIRLPSPVWFFSLFLAFALVTGAGVSVLRKTWQIVLFSLLCFLLPAAAAAAAFMAGYWMDFVAPEFSVLVGLISASLLNYSLEGRQRRFIKSVFRHYLSPEVIERIIRNPSLLQLGGEKREISCFFSDVAGFTSISESLSPEELVNLLNAYLSEMTDIILDSGGTLDKYEGDAIIAFWNAPLDQPDHALRACRAAIRCQKKLAELRPVFRERFGRELFMRIGLNSGPAVVGNMGSRRRFDYTAMGDTMNLAARLEGACKLFKVEILVGESTYEKVKDKILAREVDLIRVIGKKQPIRVFSPVGEFGEVSPSEWKRVEVYHEALQTYRRREWPKALTLFEKLRDDGLAEMYIGRCLHFQQSPPSEEWDGVFELKEK